MRAPARRSEAAIRCSPLQRIQQRPPEMRRIVRNENEQRRTVTDDTERVAWSDQMFRAIPENLLYPMLYPTQSTIHKLTANQMDKCVVDIKVQNIE